MSAHCGGTTPGQVGLGYIGKLTEQAVESKSVRSILNGCPSVPVSKSFLKSLLSLSDVMCKHKLNIPLPHPRCFRSLF